MIPTIDQIRSIHDVQTVYQWDLKFAAHPSALPAPPGEGEPNLRCESIDLPNRTDQTIITSIRGKEVGQPGIHQFSKTLALTFVETVEAPIRTWIMNWSRICADERTGYHYKKSEVEAVILLHLMNRQHVPNWEFQLFGCFLQDWSMGTVDGSTSDAMKPTMTLHYDYFIQSPL